MADSNVMTDADVTGADASGADVASDAHASVRDVSLHASGVQRSGESVAQLDALAGGPAAQLDAFAGELAAKLDALAGELRRLGRLVVAFSGGADSAFLAAFATRTLGSERVRCVTAVSPSLAGEEADDCRALADEWSLRWTPVTTREMERAAYRANDLDRCFHCKAELMDVIAPVAETDGATVVLGVNVDDLGDHRPGQEAASRAGAVFPLVAAGFTKAAVRAASRQLGLRTWDKPAAACLASRVPYGTEVTVAVLSRVDRAEAALHRLGFRQVRVRHFDDTARIELEGDDLLRAVERRVEVVEAVKAAGYRTVALDLEGFRSGKLNDGVIGSRP